MITVYILLGMDEGCSFNVYEGAYFSEKEMLEAAHKLSGGNKMALHIGEEYSKVCGPGCIVNNNNNIQFMYTIVENGVVDG
jgi:hypothetical protein